MSAISLDARAVRGLLEAVAVSLDRHSEELRELDAKVGDGDLGVTAQLMAEALRDFAASDEETDVGRLLMQCGMAVNRANPSTFGTIVATGFMGAGSLVVGKTSIGLEDWVVMGEAAIEKIKTRGKAEVGDKTLLDALVPAVVSLRHASEEGGDERAAVRSAVDACEQGMQATTVMIAKRGKARAFQEKSVGVQDGGATAVYFMARAAAEYLEGPR